MGLVDSNVEGVTVIQPRCYKGTDHLPKVTRGQVALGSKVERTAPNHRTKLAVNLKGTVKDYPEVPDRVPDVGGKGT